MRCTERENGKKKEKKKWVGVIVLEFGRRRLLLSNVTNPSHQTTAWWIYPSIIKYKTTIILVCGASLHLFCTVREDLYKVSEWSLVGWVAGATNQVWTQSRCKSSLSTTTDHEKKFLSLWPGSLYCYYSSPFLGIPAASSLTFLQTRIKCRQHALHSPET